MGFFMAAFFPFSLNALPVHELSARYRNWSYYTGGLDGFVVPPLAGNFTGQTLTDTALVFEKTEEDTLPGKYRMTYLFFNGTAGGYGYETALATSDDLLNWSFGKGGLDDDGIVFPRSSIPGTYDYGGVTFGGLHFTQNSLRSPRKLQKTGGQYHALYGCYPSRSGYEAGNGGQGVASSNDGVSWHRVSKTVPALSGGSNQLPKWESEVVYQPFLVEHNGSLFDFYNARGVNQYGKQAEESGVAELPVSLLPGILQNQSLWQRKTSVSPVIKSGPRGSPDTAMASDPKVFWDEEQSVWVMFYFGVGDSTAGHADILIAFSDDLYHWDKDPVPLYVAGGHPLGIDKQHAHKVSLIYGADGVGYMYYTAVGPKGRGIALLTSKPRF